MERQGNRPGRRARTSQVSGLLLAAAISGAAQAQFHYSLTLDEALRSVAVEVRLPPGDGRPLQAEDGRPNDLHDLTDCQGIRLPLEGGKIHAGPARDCIRYRAPIRTQSGRRSPPVTDGVRVVTPGEWLWIPQLQAGERLVIDVNAPDTLSLSVPWTPLGDRRFELAPSPGSATGTAVFGSFPHPTLAVGDAALRVAVLDGPGLPVDEDRMLEWLRVAAEDVASVGGRFPDTRIFR